MQWKQQEKQLKYIWIVFAFQERHSDSELEVWMEPVRDSGITCVVEYKEKRSVLSGKCGSIFAEKSLVEYPCEHTLVLTDSMEIADICSKNGYVCIGLDPVMETFFTGAEAVVSSLNDLDCIYMEEIFLRAKGYAVLIAETERIRIREIRKQDIPVLYEISRQDGMEYAFADPEQAECFEVSRMEAYIENVYRFYGYGLWTVETLQGEIIGCCGLSDADVTEYEAEKTSFLELQYFVANRFQNQGYGTEMCRTVMRYAAERLPEYELCVRVHPQNIRSVKLAEKLGVRLVSR